jgi:hypothetical protein
MWLAVSSSGTHPSVTGVALGRRRSRPMTGARPRPVASSSCRGQTEKSQRSPGPGIIDFDQFGSESEGVCGSTS